MIYLDYAATTPVDKRVLKKMQPYFSQYFANPASIHSLGQAALKAVEDARHSIADLLNAKASELVFTSGATEANNLALRGVLKNLRQKGDTRRHVITLAIEHDSVLETLYDLEVAGYEIERLGVNKQGVIDLKKLEKAIRPDTSLISIAFVNSEVGVIQPIDRIGRLIRNINERRYKLWLNTPARSRGEKPRLVYFHTDATQAFNCLDCDVQHLKVDMLSLSAHKVYGPKGAGLLYVKKDTPMYAQQYGGHQERNMRSGTLNVPAIIGFAEALAIADTQRKRVTAALTKLRKSLVKDIVKLIPSAIIASDLSNSVPSHLNILFPPLEGDA
jgi:cysteine desulfurase